MRPIFCFSLRDLERHVRRTKRKREQRRLNRLQKVNSFWRSAKYFWPVALAYVAGVNGEGVRAEGKEGAEEGSTTRSKKKADGTPAMQLLARRISLRCRRNWRRGRGWGKEGVERGVQRHRRRKGMDACYTTRAFQIRSFPHPPPPTNFHVIRLHQLSITVNPFTNQKLA